jgi:hypothetical protein
MSKNGNATVVAATLPNLLYLERSTFARPNRFSFDSPSFEGRFTSGLAKGGVTLMRRPAAGAVVRSFTENAATLF